MKELWLVWSDVENFLLKAKVANQDDLMGAQGTERGQGDKT